jgi:hypothetical protein
VRAALPEVRLDDANLAGARLARASLIRAELQGATMTGVDLRNASLLGADLGGVNLQDAALDEADLHATIGAARVRWPAGFDRQAARNRPWSTPWFGGPCGPGDCYDGRHASSGLLKVGWRFCGGEFAELVWWAWLCGGSAAGEDAAAAASSCWTTFQ